MLLFDAPEAASPPREDPFHCGSVCVSDLLIQDSIQDSRFKMGLVGKLVGRAYLAMYLAPSSRSTLPFCQLNHHHNILMT